MSLKTKLIPTLNPSEFGKHFFGDLLDWKPNLASFHELFHINRIEDTKKHLKFPLPPHRQTVSDFIFLTNGYTRRSKGLDYYTFSANTFFFLPMNQITIHEFMSDDTTGFYCHFSPEIFNNRFIQPATLNEFSFLQFFGDPMVKIDEAHTAPIVNILERLEKEYYKKEVSFNLISAYLLTLFFELTSWGQSKEKTTENAASRTTRQFKNLLMQFAYEKFTISEYAGKLAVSPNHLNKCVKATTGKSAQELLCEMILLEAKALLKQTDLTVSEIAWKIRKEDPSDFTHFFKAKTGLTPTEYRKMD